MSIRKLFLIVVVSFCAAITANAQDFNQIDETGNITQRNENRNFNKHNTDTTSNNKDIPKGIHVWTIDRRFGDIIPTQVDTLPHLFQNTVHNTGVYRQYNTTGNNYTVRQSRIVTDRPLFGNFIFTQPYDFVIKEPDQLHFTNTLSPITNITYDECGDKMNGEDHIDAKFAVNAGKRLGFGFDINYAYARGYFSNQSTSHFGFTLYSSYLGDKYQMHSMFSTYNQKVAENGGITDDAYITLPESFNDDFASNEIPTVLEQNWNRNKHLHFFLTHRYNLGFYRMVPRTEEEIKARKFAAESKKENEDKKLEKDIDGNKSKSKLSKEKKKDEPSGRPDGAVIMGDAPVMGDNKDIAADSTRIKVDQHALDSIAAEKARQDSIDIYMKKEYVPVTSFIHTLDLNSNERIYQAYLTPENYYANKYFNALGDNSYQNDSIYDQTKYLQVKNTVAIAMLEGFNKWAKAGLKIFASHDMMRFKLPAIIDEEKGLAALQGTTEHNISIGAQINKTQGKTLHYNLTGETWIAGDNAGQLKLDFNTDLNFRLFGDTLTLAAKASFYRLEPTYYLRHYHSKHFWWDNDDLSKETRTKIEGILAYKKTNTRLRLAVEEIQNYTYFGMSYDAENRGNLTAGVRQQSSNINLLTAQLYQDFRLGPLNWENVITYQNSNSDALPVPDLNIFTNLYLKFKIVKELAVEFGASATYFTKYYAPDYCPQIGQFAIQENEASRVELGGYPFVDIYANFHLKRTRFFLSYTHANAGSGNKMQFLVPHYAQNNTVLRFGLSWNFFN